MSDDRSRSILLQVAFKEAASKGSTLQEVENLTVQYFELLESLHNRLGIDTTSTSPTSSRTRRTRTTGTSQTVTGPEFVYDGTVFVDFRAAKETNAVNPKYPDFKTKDGSPVDGITNKDGAVWLIDQDGVMKEGLNSLVEAADAAAIL